MKPPAVVSNCETTAGRLFYTFFKYIREADSSTPLFTLHLQLCARMERKALMKPSRSPFMTLSMLPFS